MKIHWGTGIFLFYSTFAIVLFYQVYKSTQYDHSLVAENYYEKDLAYQAMFEKKENSMRLEKGLTVNYLPLDQVIELIFPNALESPKGKILFYRADDKSKDFSISLHLDSNNKMVIPTENLSEGKWKIEIDWQASKRAYFDEKNILIETIN